MQNENTSMDKTLAELTDDELVTDAGSKARAKIDQRQPEKSTRLSKVMVFIAWLLPLLVISSGLVMFKVWENRTTTGYHYKRSCELPKEVGMDITGTRRYLNKASEFLGMKFIDTKQADEETMLNSSMKEISVTGIKGGEWWTMYNSASEPRVIKLKPADTYIFTQDSKTFVISYEEFCK